MKLAIGDVVRDRSDMALGTVIGVTSQTGGNLVAFYVSSHTVRLGEPDRLDVVARHTKPPTKARRVLALIAFSLALLAAFLGGHSARETGADWPLTSLASLGGYMAVAMTYHWGGRLTGPRRFHV
ncbi:hypothetical protein OG883_31960 [Streptomyces sp. NBC_01142]|uniref:hypothetical protein n=1 Tax=Streptomyces sp. NBC_01142 TaxID=2975865 RepID=UPI00225A1497|nr:hypothetical protein [Streptomyces sp. NBC_01142]MCX4824391.1 hypothetical protein [Streptomyces sp. NBC_01142]